MNFPTGMGITATIPNRGPVDYGDGLSSGHVGHGGAEVGFSLSEQSPQDLGDREDFIDAAGGLPSWHQGLGPVA